MLTKKEQVKEIKKQLKKDFGTLKNVEAKAKKKFTEAKKTKIYKKTGCLTINELALQPSSKDYKVYYFPVNGKAVLLAPEGGGLYVRLNTGFTAMDFKVR